MRSKYRLFDNESLYFITSSIQKFMPVFTSESYFNILIDSFRYSQEKKNLKVYSYVLMDNHFHSIVGGEKLSDTMRSIKSFTAKKIMEQINNDEKDWLINQFRFYKLKHKKESEHQIWQEGFHPQIIYSMEVFNQKVEYIHNNPVKRGLVAEPQYWRYSSANTILFGQKGELDIESIF